MLTTRLLTNIAFLKLTKDLCFPLDILLVAVFIELTAINPCLVRAGDKGGEEVNASRGVGDLPASDIGVFLTHVESIRSRS